MTTAAAKRTMAATRKGERDRKRRLRAGMAAEGIPSRVAIEHALALALRRTVITSYGEPGRVDSGSDLQAVVREAVDILTEGGFRLQSPRSRALFAKAIGA